MPYSREQLEAVWIKDKPAEDFHPFERGKKYLDRDVPDELFPIQEWCIQQGGSPAGSLFPDLSSIFQGLEYILQTAAGNYTEDVRDKLFEPSEMAGMMDYLNSEGDFEGGALRQFPELQEIIKKALLGMPRGQEVIRAIQGVEKYSDLFL